MPDRKGGEGGKCEECLGIGCDECTVMREWHIQCKFVIVEQVEVMAGTEAEAIELAKKKCGRQLDEYHETDFYDAG